MSKLVSLKEQNKIERAKAKFDELVYGAGFVKETYDKNGKLIKVKRIDPFKIKRGGKL